MMRALAPVTDEREAALRAAEICCEDRSHGVGCASLGGAAARRERQSRKRPIAMLVLWPPKPSELLTQLSTCNSLAVLGT